ncbi:hypothetical protein Syun_009295 [Stephania yunnanensis]|uniref:Protein FRA10AC1 n=1 Tax=Stephania yunnanensis TaxID=152371 RepID=A0AAP0PS58_9MAGN
MVVKHCYLAVGRARIDQLFAKRNVAVALWLKVAEMASFGSLKLAIFDAEERKIQYQAHIRGLNAYDRHKKFVKEYVDLYRGESKKVDVLPLPSKTVQDTIREGYRFIRSAEDDADSSWEQRLVKRYYDKLFKEYCIADMSHYKTGKIGLRWRTEKEVISGKGQFVCGNKQCDENDNLASYEAKYSFVFTGENKQALVKLVACPRCADKLSYKRQKDKQFIKGEKDEPKRKRERSESHNDTNYEHGSGHKGRKGKKTSTDDCENFDEFLEGLFP